MSSFDAHLYLTDPEGYIDEVLNNQRQKQTILVNGEELAIHTIDKLESSLVKRMIGEDGLIKNRFSTTIKDLSFEELTDMVKKDFKVHRNVQIENNTYYFNSNNSLKKRYLVRVDNSKNYFCIEKKIS